MNYPASLDDTSSLPDPTGNTSVGGNVANPGLNHGELHAQVNATLRALEAKLGAGASTPPAQANRFLVTDAAGKTTWAAITVTGDLTGTFPNLSLNTIAGVAGTYGDGTHIPILQVDNKGRIIGISITPVVGGGGGGGGAISPLTTKGDIWVYATADARLAVGSNGQVLSADSTTLSGLKWITPQPGVWGSITGDISTQTDLQTALGLKVNTSTYNALVASLKPVATSGAYADLTGTPDLSVYLPKAGGTMTGALTLSGDPTNNLHAATKQYVDNHATVSLKPNIIPTGTINGTNTTFTVPDIYAAGSLAVYLNGQRLISGASNDYVESAGGFTMNYAPATGDVLEVDYTLTNGVFVQGSNSIIVGEAPQQTPDNTTTAFTVQQNKYIANSLEVTINGVIQVRGTDFTETTPGSGIFTFTVAPRTGEFVRCSYQFASGAAGNADTVDGIHASDVPVNGQLVPFYGGWYKLPLTVSALTYVSANTFNIVGGDYTAVLPKGSKIKLDQGGTTKYWNIGSSTYTAGTNTTQIVIVTHNDFTLANAAISNFFYSYMESPIGFPGWFNYTPSYTGFSAAPALGVGSIRFRIIGNTVQVQHNPTTLGTSNTTGFTITLPITAKSSGQWDGPIRVADSANFSFGLYEITAGSLSATIFKDANGTVFTASGSKTAQGLITYEM